MTEYKAALAEWHSAADAFHAMGEPQSGPAYDRLTAAAERFRRAQCPEDVRAEDRSLSWATYILTRVRGTPARSGHDERDRRE